MGKRNYRTEAAPGSPTLALLYRRVSSHEQEEDGLSLPTQLADCRGYVARQTGWIIQSEYQDVMTGKRDDRPGYQALLTEARTLRKQGQPVVVVVKWLHRFGRRTLERVRTWEELDELDVVIHAEAEGGVVSKLVHDILAAVAEEEVRQLSARTRASWKTVRSNGWNKVGRVPFGYVMRDATDAERLTHSPKRVLEVDPLTAPYVVEMFERVARGESRRSVVRWAMALPQEVRGFRNFGLQTVADMLKNATYIARDPAGAGAVLDRPIGRWPRLVEDDVWQSVQKSLAPHNVLKHQASGAYALASILRCTRCNGRMRGMTGRNAGQRYRCEGAGEDGMPRGHCNETVARAVERTVFDQVADALSVLDASPKLRRKLEAAWERRRRAEAADGVAIDHGAVIRSLHARVERAGQRVTDALRLLLDGKIDQGAYDALILAERADADRAQRELAQLTIASQASPMPTLLPSLDQVLDELGDWRSILACGEASVQRKLLGALLERVVATRAGWGKYTVEMTWTPQGEALRELCR